MEAIVADLDTRRHDFHVAIENWQHDFNIGTIVRSANAFLAAEVHIVGNRRWNRRGAMVTDRYQHVRHHATVGRPGGVPRTSADVTLLGIDNLPGSAHLETMEMPAAGSASCSARRAPGCRTPAREACDGDLLDRPVRLDPLDQRLRRRRDRDARLDPHVRRPVRRRRRLARLSPWRG